MEVNQLRDVFSWASTATDNGSDCNGVLMHFLQKIQLLSPGWGFCFKGKVFFCEWVYDSFLVHGVYVSVRLEPIMLIKLRIIPFSNSPFLPSLFPQRVLLFP